MTKDKGFALSLVLKVTVLGIWKWPITRVSFSVNLQSHMIDFVDTK